MAAPAPAPLSGWWNDRRLLWAACALTALPLLWPQLPPLTDALGHLARYHIELAIDDSPYLRQWYSFRWALLGNLGVDLLIVPMAKIFGVQLGLKLIVLTIPPLTAAGLLWIAHEAHGRVPPTAYFALPLAYGYPFHFGFINYALSMALALVAFGFWLWLARTGRDRLRAVLFVPIGMGVWICHIYGWGVLGLLALAAEVERDRGRGGSRWHALWRAGLALLPLAPPLALMLLWRSGAVTGSTADWFNWEAKLTWVLGILRDRWKLFDLDSLALLIVLVAGGIFGLGLRFNRMLAIAAIILTATFILLPRILIGSAYADMRLAPFMLAIAIVALRPRDPHDRALATMLAIGALLFLVVRVGGNTASFYQYDRAYQRQLAALEKVPEGSRVMVLVSVTCMSQWATGRMDHLGSQAIVRRDAFANGQWTMAGAQLLTVTYKAAGRFARDPTQILRPRRCRGRGEPIWEDTLENFPRAAFDYLWLINMPRARWPHEPDLVPVWAIDDGVLFGIDHSRSTPETEAASGTGSQMKPSGR